MADVEHIIKLAEECGFEAVRYTKPCVNRKEVACVTFKFSGNPVGISFKEEELEKIDIDDVSGFISMVSEKLDSVIKSAQLRVSADRWSEMLEKSEIVPVLVNAEENAGLLEKVPHRRYLDLAVIYRLLVGEKEDGMYSVLLTYANVKGRVEEENLYKRGLDFLEKNTHYIPMEEWFEGFAPGEELPLSVLGMYILSNKRKIYGAAALLLLASGSFQLNSDAVILPSSIHEVLVLEKKEDGFKTLAEMVMDVNAAQVAPEERLSNSVYAYNSETKEVSILIDGKPLAALCA